MFIRVMVYSDDAALVEETIEDMTVRLTALTNASREHADMEVSM